MSPAKSIVEISGGPQAIGPYSTAVRAGDFLFISGQLGLDPQSGDLVSGGVEEQARQALENLRHILESAGASLSAVVKTTLFLQDMADFGRVNAIYAEFFPAEPPARSAFQVAALPRQGLVEVEAIAYSPAEPPAA